MNKFRLLNADEIECRISSVSEKGATLLLYKTARTDANLLDETVGSENWENDFKVVDGVLYGGIGVYDVAMDRWVWKWDAGTESNTEAEKGRASDAFKRAGFKHGIGRELYTAPFVFIPADKCEIKQGNKGKLVCYDNFRVVEIGYDDKGEINKLIISNDSKGVDVFTYPRVRSRATPMKEAPAPKEAPDGYYYCSSCGNVITEFRSGGNTISQKDFAAQTLLRYGKQLCKDCAFKVKNESKAS